jgi:hypothetical protein
MKTRELIEFLQKCDPEAIVIANFAFEGLTEVLTVERKFEGGFDSFFSFESVPVVELSTGNFEYMRSNGMDVDVVPAFRNYKTLQE